MIRIPGSLGEGELWLAQTLDESTATHTTIQILTSVSRKCIPIDSQSACPQANEAE